jgi:hypothetical protein
MDVPNASIISKKLITPPENSTFGATGNESICLVKPVSLACRKTPPDIDEVFSLALQDGSHGIAA